MLQIRSSGANRASDCSAAYTAPPSYADWAALAAGLALLALAFAYRCFAFKVAIFDWDEYAFALVARDVLDGKLPGAGVFDNKPVGLIYLFALVEWLGGQGVLAIRALGFFASAACGALLYRSGRKLGLSRAGALQIASLGMLGALCLNGFASMSELLATPLLAAANALLISGRRRPMELLGLGVVLGLACQITYLAAPPAALTVAGVLLTTSRTRLRDGALIGAAGAVAVLAVWVPQLVTGDWAAYAAAQIRYHQDYRTASLDWRRLLAGLVMPLAVMCLPILTAWVFRTPRTSGLKALPPLAWILGLQLLGAALAAAASNRFYTHYLILGVPAASALTALLLVGPPGPGRRAGWSGLGAVLAFAAAAPLAFLGPQLGVQSLEAKAAAAVDRLTRPDQSIFVFDEGHPLYFLAGRRSVSPYVFPTHYLSSCDGGHAIVAPAVALAQALARRPALVLVGGICPSEIDAAAQVRRAGYRRVDRIEADGRKVDVYAPATVDQRFTGSELNLPARPPGIHPATG